FGLLAFPVWWLGGILIEAANNKELLATLCVGAVIVSAFAVLFGETYMWTEIVQVPAWLLFLLMLSLAPRWGFTLIGIQHLCLVISRRRNTLPSRQRSSRHPPTRTAARRSTLCSSATPSSSAAS